MELGKSADCDETLTQRMSVLKPNACCTLIYPVSTYAHTAYNYPTLCSTQPSSSGRPRGVMLSHDNASSLHLCMYVYIYIKFHYRSPGPRSVSSHKSRSFTG